MVLVHLADMMRSCTVVTSALSMMRDTPGRGPRNDSTESLWSHSVAVGGSGVQRILHGLLSIYQLYRDVM